MAHLRRGMLRVETSELQTIITSFLHLHQIARRKGTTSPSPPKLNELGERAEAQGPRLVRGVAFD